MRQLDLLHNDSKMKLALFDVDETLLNFNSMRHFLKYFFIEYFGSLSGNSLLLEHELFMKHSKDKLSREDLNRLYYKNFKGVSQSSLSNIGRNWFDKHVLEKKRFNSLVLAELNNHKKNDRLIVLVSGGFFATLEPLKHHVNADLLLCISPPACEGFLTGDIEGIQTIGKGKAEAIKNHFQNHTIDWGNSYAYGDHISDFFMLELAGNPVVVGNDQELLKMANLNHWQRINNSE